MFRPVRLVLLFAGLVCASAPASAQITWNFTYADGNIGPGGFGFADPTSGQLRRDTLTAVTGYLNTVLDARGTVNFNWQVSDNSPNSGTLASAGTSYSWPGGGGTLLVGNVYRQATGNLTTGTPGSGQVNFGWNWFATGSSGTGTPGSNQIDLYSVLLHELTHSLHFGSVLNADGSSQFGAGIYTRYDGFVYRGATGGTKQLNAAGTAYQGASGDLTSNDIYWGGRFGVAANGGNRIKLYAPDPYEPGSSISHIDEATYGTALMTPAIGFGQTARQYSGREIGMLLDLGWNNFEWNNTTGNWSDGATSITNTRWSNSAIQFSDQRILAPLGTVTHNLMLTFGGNSDYTSTNDVATTFMLNRLILNGTGTSNSLSTIAGAAGSRLEFGFDNGFNVTPQVEQQGSRPFAITSDVQIPNGLIVTGDGTGAVTFGGVVGGPGSLTKSGASTAVLTGNNTYGGGTTLSAGTLLVNGQSGSNSGTGPGTVAVNGGTLGGNGRIAGAVTVNSGGTVAPGTSAPGTLTLGNGITFNSGATLAVRLNGSTAGSQYDQLDVTGSVTLGGATLSRTLGGGYSPAGSSDHLFIIVNDGTDAVSGTFNGLANGASFVIGSTTAYIYYDGDSSTNALSGGNDVVISFVPVPEPGAVLGVAAAALGFGALLRRRAAGKRTSPDSPALAA